MATLDNSPAGSSGNTGKTALDLTPDHVFEAGVAPVVVPVGDALLQSDYSRHGQDLQLETPDGVTILITGYFTQEVPPDLFTLAGSRITPDVAAKLAGPLAPGQIAQAGSVTALEEPIGSIDTLKGQVTVIRADGTQAVLEEGAPLYQGDTLVSGDAAAIGIIFADKSTMSMSANGRIILDELVYNAEAPTASSQVFNVIKGAFVFTSGAIGKADPDAVSVNTPVATIGIRGTKFGFSVDALDGSTNVTVLEGAVYVQNGGGAVLLTGIGETTLIPSYAQQPSDPRVIDVQEIQERYGDAIGFHPVRQEIPDVGDDSAELDDETLQEIADDLNDIQTAAGEEEDGDEGANQEFIEIVEGGEGGDAGGTATGSLGGTDGDEGDGTGTGIGGDEGEEDDPIVGETPPPGIVEDDPIEIGFDNPTPEIGEDGVQRFSLSAPLSSNSIEPITAPDAPGVTQELSMDGSGLGSTSETGQDANLTLQGDPNFSPEDDRDVKLTDDAGLDLSISGFEELALTLGGGNDNVSVGNLDGTDIINETVTLLGGDGDDTLSGQADTNRNLVLEGGDGNDTLTGGNLDDVINGGADDDLIEGGLGTDDLDGGSGIDTVSYENAASGVGVDLSTGTAVGGDGNDTIANVENIVGSDFSDTLIGDDGANVIEGQDGDDTIDGLGGDDTILGGEGDDTIQGGQGSDDLQGGAGLDILGGGIGDDTLSGGDEADVLSGDEGDDTLLGGDGGDTLIGGAGSDVVSGDAGNDVAFFSIRSDEIDAENGPASLDTYDGGADTDTLVIVYTAEDLLNETVADIIQALRDHIGGGINVLGPIGEDMPDTTPLGLSHSGFENLVLEGPVPPAITTEASGNEDSAIALTIALHPDDLGNPPEVPSSIDSITVSGLNGAVLSAGNVNPDGSVSLTPAELEGLTVTPPSDSNVDLNLTVSVGFIDSASGSVVSLGGGIAVDVIGVADAPTLEVEASSGQQDTAIPLTISSGLADTDGSEDLTVTITAIPAGAVLHSGEQVIEITEGSATLTADQLSGLTITPPAGDAADFTLQIAATAAEDDGDTATVNGTIDVTVTLPPVLVNAVLEEGQDASFTGTDGEAAEHLILDASFGGSTASDVWTIAQDEQGRVTLTNQGSGQVVTIDGFEDVDIDFGPGTDTVHLTDLSSTDLTNDTLTIRTGDGNDTVTAAEDVNRDLEIFGGDGDDNLEGSNGDDLIDGGAGNDRIEGNEGVDQLDGGEESDTYIWNEDDGQDAYADSGTSGTDTIITQSNTFAGFQNDFDAEEAGIEEIGYDTDDGNEAVNTGKTLTIVGDDDEQDWDLGNLAFLNTTTSVELGNGDDVLVASDLSAATYDGGEGADQLFGGQQEDDLRGGDDDDTIKGGGGNDRIVGGEGVDDLDGEDGSDTYIWNAGDGRDNFNDTGDGEGDTDTIISQSQDFEGLQADFNGAEAGIEAIGYDSSDGNEEANPGKWLDIEGSDGNENWNFASVEFLNNETEIDGNDGDDTIVASDISEATYEGNDGDDTLIGGAQKDDLQGDDGDDTITGGGGNDRIVGGEGVDDLDGEDGSDTYIWNAGDGRDNFNDTGDGEGDTDTIISQSQDFEGLQADFNGAEAGIEAIGYDSSDGNEEANPGKWLDIEGSDGNENWNFATVEFLNNETEIDGNDGDDTIVASDISEATYEGNDGDDTLIGGAQKDDLQGDDGDDTITGGGGNDRIVGGEGVDDLDGEDGSDTYIWEAGDGRDKFNDTGDGEGDTDTIISQSQNFEGLQDDFNGAEAGIEAIGYDSSDGNEEANPGKWLDIEGSDQNQDWNFATVEFLNNQTEVDGNDGDDRIVASDISEATYEGGEGRDELIGGLQDDDLRGEEGDDSLLGGAGEDDLRGGEGSDLLDGEEGSDTYLWQAGDGQDTYADSGTTGQDRIVVQASTFDGFRDGFVASESGIEEIGRDSSGNGSVNTGQTLTVVTSDSSDTLDLFGIDFLNNQTIVDLDDGDDEVSAAAGDGGDVTYLGGEGQDTINLILTPQALAEVIAAGELDTLQSYLDNPAGQELSLGSQNIEARGFEIAQVVLVGENGEPVPNFDLADLTDDIIEGTAGNNVLTGTNEDDIVLAGGGNDLVYGLFGDDALFGEDGADTLHGGSGDDLIDGGDGDDQLHGGQGDDFISGGDGDDRIFEFKGDNVLSGGDGDDTVFGGTGNDEISGDAGDDQLIGGSGDDLLIGGEGTDILQGGFGNDTLIGGDAGDSLSGDAGDDLLISKILEESEDGPDAFVDPVAQAVFDAFESLRDGGTGEDTLRLEANGSDSNTLSGAQFADVRNIETLDLSGVEGVQLSLTVDDVVSMTDTDNELTILLGEDVSSVQIGDETIEVEDGQAVFEQDDVLVTLQQQQQVPDQA